jgi:hypothetical protein
MNSTAIQSSAIWAVLLGVALSWYARFRFVANDPGENPFAGRRWRLFPPRAAYRTPGLAVQVVGMVMAFAGAILLLVNLIR